MNNNHTGRNILLVFLSLFLLAGAFSGGFITGWLLPDRTSLENPISLPLSTEISPSEESTPTDTTTLFAPFWEAWSIVHDQYIDQPVDDNQLMQGAIRGMMESLGDEHSSYMDPDEYKEATTSLDGSYEGIGAYVDTTTEYLTIISPMPGSPAEEAGLKAGDEVVRINGEDMTGIDPSIVLKSVKGPAGTDVTLSIHRPSSDEIFDVTITRKSIELQSVTSEMKEGDIAYIAISTFGETTTADLKDALKTLLKQNPKGLILDLRNNGGGYLDTAVEVISQFISDGVVLIEQQSNGEELTYDALPGGLATDIPMVVLVNEGSASASEITAGAIQDYGRGKLVGVTTYGKGSVQNWIPLSDNQGAVRVTIARWLTPNHRQIHKIGLTPDVVIELTEEDIEAEHDAQLEKAIEILQHGE